ncbi:MAG: glycosyltransferase family 4 protein [Fusobacterium sp.]|uniref:glycosyltransferase family 4 protein n=1 Tax=Fusobacterium sp. TaxID=68766 RepID=UPI002A74EB46|nr:glycosyltransferase family 4 protein [Fusobacterium sp.]MDY3060760.1 glycosyltransferase family 4 protein [Fusobacterium sp.]
MKKIILNANTLFAVYNFRCNLMKRLSKEGYEIICLGNRDSSAEQIVENGWRYIDAGMDRRGTSILNDLKLFFFYLKVFKEEKPEYILNFTIKPNIYGTLAAKLVGVPVINNVTGLGDIFDTENITSKIVKILYKISFRFPKRVFFQNDDDMKIFLDNKLIDKKLCDRLPGSGVEVQKFFPEELVKEDNKIRFLFLGRISVKKGVRIINEVSKILTPKYPNIEFQLLGKVYIDEEGHISKEELSKWEKESNIKYLGTSKDVRNEIKKVDCIIFPSYYREGVPRSLIESASMGKPILTTDNVGCRDIVEDGYNGYLANPNDVDSMVEIVEKFLKLSEDRRKVMGENGRNKVLKEFDEKIVINKYLKVIKGEKNVND